MDNLVSTSEFDRYAGNYDRDLAEALSATGESKDFFAQGRADWLASRLSRLQAPADRILDFGCGIGSNSPILQKTLHAKTVLGIDVSSESINEAQSKYGNADLRFSTIGNFRPDASYDVAVTSGVFHHIPVADRPAALETVRASLKPGGLFALWENNPWNPGTQYVMFRCAFDGDAIKISVPAARKLVSRAGFQILRTDSLFYFPRQLRFLRPLERWLRGIPLGGQYMVLVRKS